MRACSSPTSSKPPPFAASMAPTPGATSTRASLIGRKVPDPGRELRVVTLDSRRQTVRTLTLTVDSVARQPVHMRGTSARLLSLTDRKGIRLDDLALRRRLEGNRAWLLEETLELLRAPTLLRPLHLPPRSTI